MGVNYYSDLIVGVIYEELVTTEYETIEEKKFNPDTGEPYIRKTNKSYETFLDKRIDESKYEDSPTYQVEKMGLYVIEATYDEKYIGLCLSHLGDGGSNIEGFEKIKNIYEEVKNKLQKAGYNEDPKFIHLLYAS